MDVEPATYYIGNVKVVRNGNDVLLIRGFLACPHEVRHIHYYTTKDKTDEELSKLIEWLEWGFWWDSFLETDDVLEKRFLNGRCMGNAHFL
jgi:hypothetical protein